MIPRGAGWGGAFWTGVLAGAGATLALCACRAAWGIPMPQEALAERIVRLLPEALFTLLLAELQHAAKPLGFAAAVLLSLGGFGLVGVIYAHFARAASRRRRITLALATGAASWLAIAYLVLPLIQGGLLGEPLTAAVPATAPSLPIASAIYGVLLAYLSRPKGVRIGTAAPGVHREATMSAIAAGQQARKLGGSMTRRVLLQRSALALVIGAAVSGLIIALSAWRRRMSTGGSGAGPALSPQGTSRQLFHLIRGMPPEVTANARFYRVSKNYPFDPVVDAAKWALEVTGLVTTPLRFSYAQFVTAAAVVERYQTLECISNPVGGDLIGNARWTGVRVRDLLALAQLKPEATAVVWRSADGYSESVPLGAAMDPECLLAFEMNGRPLPRQHGAPLRVLLPNRYGMKQPKWLTAIEVADAASLGPWEHRRFRNPAIVKTHSAILVHAHDTRALQFGGWAFAGRRGIAAVELSPDGGRTWFAAAVKPPLEESCWQFWSAEWVPPASGEYALSVRARDGTGALQVGRWRRAPDGAEGYHKIQIRVPG